MLRTPLRILLVDDNTSAETDVATSLRNNGYDPTIRWEAPTERDQPLCGCDLPTARELEQYDLALVDLELFYPLEHTRYRASDLQGGTIILPYLRHHAPWLPVVAESRLLVRDRAKECLPLAGSFGFDGLLARDFFVDGSTDRALWEELRRSAELRRLQAVLGDDFHGNSTTKARFANVEHHEIDAHSYQGAVLAAVSTAFYFAESVTLDKMAPGFSGADIFRGTVIQRDLPNRAGFWAVKTSRALSKLTAELRAHLEMTRAGQEFAVAVPSLWRGVVARAQVGLIAYHFADGTVPASAAVRKDLDTAAREIATLITRFHGAPGDWSRCVASPREVVRDFGPSAATLSSAVAELPRICRAFYTRLLDDDSGPLATTARFSATRVHGDMHLDNILIGERALLIDFARSKIGPRVVDLARLYSDIFRVLGVDKKLSVMLSSETNAPIYNLMGPLGSMVRALDPYDAALFDVLTWCYLAAFVAYEDSDDTFRTWLRRELVSFTRRLDAVCRT